MRALKQLNKIVAKVKRKANPDLTMRIVRTMVDLRTSHARDIFEEIARVGGELVSPTFIKRTIKVADAALAGEPILVYATDSEVAAAYRALAQELSDDHT